MPSSTNRKSGNSWKETRHDKWYVLAKEQGYRSRAAFKLLQLNRQFDFLSQARAVLDLGAAPGGWLQVCVKCMPASSLIMGVDLNPIVRMRGVTTLQVDMTSSECRTLIKKELQGWDVDVVLHDGAPHVAGGQVWSKDAYQQNELVVYALRLATHFLRPGGTFVTKVFRSQDYNALLWTLNQLFAQVVVTKPMASRNASAEIFVVCRQYKAPKKIDPFLLDPAHIFEQFEETKSKDVFADKGKVGRSRMGYDDVATSSGLIRTTCDIFDFVRAEEPIGLMGSFHSFTFDSEDAQTLLSHSSTTPEVLALCEDLKVLGKGDFKALLKWRKKVCLWLKELATEKPDCAETPDEHLLQPETDEQKLGREELEMTAAIEALQQKQVRESKMSQRKKHSAKMKLQRRMLLNKNNLSGASEMIGGNEAEGQGEELFKLSSVTDVEALEFLEVQGEAMLDVNEDHNVLNYPLSLVRSDVPVAMDMANSDHEENAYYDELEKELDSMYEQYKQKRHIVDKHDLEKKALAEQELFQGILDMSNSTPNANDSDNEKERASVHHSGSTNIRKRNRTEANMDAEVENGTDKNIDKASNPLILTVDVPMTNKRRQRLAQRFFDREIFADLKNDSPLSQECEDSEALPSFVLKKKNSHKTGLNLTEMMSNVDGSDTHSESSASEEEPTSAVLEVDDNISRVNKRSSSARLVPHNEKRLVPLVGLDSMGKSRVQIEQEHYQTVSREREAAKKARRQTRRVAQMLDVPVHDSPATSFDDTSTDGQLVPQFNDLDSKKKAKRLARRLNRETGGGDESDKDMRDFEEVTALSDYSNDDEAIATTLALGTKSIVKKQREEMLDASYNRFSVDLKEMRELPQWFVHEERLHNTANLPVTKEEINSIKARLHSINDKPIKKIAEAAARNKQRTERRWQKIKNQMEEVTSSIGQDGSNAVSKIKAIEKLVAKKDKRKQRGDKKYIITKKGGGGLTAKSKVPRKGSGPVVAVDKRLKKDKLGVRRARQKQSKSAKTSNKRRRNQ